MMEIKVRFDHRTNTVAMVFGPGLLLMAPDTFKLYADKVNEVKAQIEDWELKHGDGELNADGALAEFERMLRDV